MRPLTRGRSLAAALAGALLLGLLAAAGGCSLHNPYPVGSFERGAYYAERGNNAEAVAALESFVRHNPTDSLAAEAQYLKGTTYLNMKEYPLAAVEFQILRKDYPTSDRVEDAFFQEGMAYFDQVGRIERDMSGAYDARTQFQKFLDTYPRSPRVPEVREKLQEIADLLVRKRLEQIQVYRQLHHPQAVAVVLDQVLKDEPTSSLVPEVLWQRAKNAEQLDDNGTARTMYERLRDDYPETPQGQKASRALLALRGEVAPESDGG